MKLTLSRILVGGMTILLLPIISFAESPTNDEINKLGRNLFQKESFQDIDKLADVYRKQRTITKQGYLALQQLYSGINDLCPDRPDEVLWKPLKDSSEKWMRLYPSSPTAILVTAQFQICHAAKQRGSAWAKDTPEENLRKFELGIEEARNLLDSKKAIAAIDPQWYSLRIDAANFSGGQKSSILDLAKRGLDLEPQMYPIYYNALQGLLPRWGGSTELVNQLIKIGDSHVSAELGDQFYGRITYVLARDFGGEELVAEHIDLNRARLSFETIVKKYPDAKNFNYAAAVSCLIHDYTGLKAYLNKIGPNLDVSAWFKNKKFMDDCVALAK